MCIRDRCEDEDYQKLRQTELVAEMPVYPQEGYIQQVGDIVIVKVSEDYPVSYTHLVYKGLGEMQNLAADVGGLKQVLSGVKTRGILVEIQLGAILEEILAPEQYDTCLLYTSRCV